MDAVQERFCKEYGLSRAEFGQLTQRVKHAVKMQEKVHNNEDRSLHNNLEQAADNACKRVTDYAKGFGITVRWDDGIYPSFIKGEHDRTLPFKE